MYKRDISKKIVEILKRNGARKPVHLSRRTFHISDDSGTSKDFYVKESDKMVSYTIDDVEAIMNAYIEVVAEAVMVGEPVSIREIGTLTMRYIGPRRGRGFDGQPFDIAAHYTPTFIFSNKIKRCVKVFESRLLDDSLPSKMDILRANDGVIPREDEEDGEESEDGVSE